MNIQIDKRAYWLIPILMVLIFTLAISLNYAWPLSWDIFIHINYALTYINHGITTIDPLLNAPGGKAIGYPPMFHALLILVSKLTGLSLFDSAKVFQVVIPVIFMIICMYVSYRMYNEISALVTGLILVSSYIFTRLYLPIPESVTMVLFFVGIYLFHLACRYGKAKYVLVSAIISLLIVSIHFSSFIYYIILLSVLMVVELFIERTSRPFKSYIYFLYVLAVVGLIGAVLLYIISPSHLMDLIGGAVSIISDPMSIFMGQKAMGLERYIKCLGVIVLVCGIVGLYYSFKDRRLLFVSMWTLVAFVLSNLHWFGIPVYTYRMLIYVLMPAVIVGGYGVARLVEKLNTKNKSYSIILILALIILSFIAGYNNINDPALTTTSATTEASTYQIAPPTSSEVEVINWFENADHNKSILSNNMFFATVISSTDQMPIHYKFDTYIAQNHTTTQKSMHKEKIGYILYDKNLVVNNSSSYAHQDVICINGSFYPTYYFTNKITDENFHAIQPEYTTKVFENDRFIICQVQ